MPTDEQWEAKLARAVDPTGAVSDKGGRAVQLRMVLGRYAVGDLANIHSQSIEDGGRMIDTLLSAAVSGELDGLFLGTEALGNIARRLEDVALGDTAEQYRREGGGLQHLLTPLESYVRQHPFPEPAGN